MEYDIIGFVHPLTPRKCHCRVVLKHDLTQADFSKHELTKRFNVYMNFTVTCRTNSLVYKRELTSRQEEMYEIIKSMHDSGPKLLNAEGSRTAKNKEWRNSNVYGVLKR